MKSFDAIILGAGAAGLFCALTAGQRGRKVLVLERANKIGKKILMSGGGRCNFTNLHIEPDCYLSANPHFCKSALSRYTQWQFIELVEKHGIAYHEKTQGQLFCDESSKQIVEMLVAECDAVGVEIITDCETSQVEQDNGFNLTTSRGSFSAPALVVAAGGLSIPKLGGSNFGYKLAEQFGHEVLPLRAGLVPFVFSDGFREVSERLSGVSVAVTLAAENKAFDDQMLFTHRGLSGPAVLQLSSYWQPGERIRANLLPSLRVADWLKGEKVQRPRALLRNVLAERLPRKLVQELEALWWPEQAARPLADWTDKSLLVVSEQLAGWQLKPAATEGYRTAEVTLGGASTERVSSQTMMSELVDGLFLVGEVVDVTGHLGGFNFQWAWASGWAAGQQV